MIERSVLARCVEEFSARSQVPLIVGNGYLAREVAALSRRNMALPLQGGMGLAAGVAAGLALTQKFAQVVVLEGDGNHVMGWGCGQFIGYLRLPVIHVVGCNGAYESTGGQPIPWRDPLDHMQEAASVLGYHRALSVVDEAQLKSALQAATLSPLPVLIYAAQEPSGTVPIRCDDTTRAYTAALAAVNRCAMPSSSGEDF